MQKIILRASASIFVIFLILTYFINWGVRYLIEESRFATEAQSLFWQIDLIIQDNNEEVEEIETNFANQCLVGAMTVAAMAESNHALYEDMEALQKTAALIGVDEIHFFDTEGLLYFGTHPEYYGYSFSSGAQMQFFQPMLSDKTMMLCQDITPNTAESKPMQYAAVWNDSGTGIVQIGVTPDRVLAAQEGNNISDVFTVMPIGEGQIFLAIDPETYEIVGATNKELVGMDISDFNITPTNDSVQAAIESSDLGRYSDDTGNFIYLAHETEDLLIVILYDKAFIYDTVTTDSIIVSGYIILFAIMSVIFITTYLNRKIIRSIHTINGRLEQIEQGDLSVQLKQDSVPEIKALSHHINSMVKSLINQTHKLSLTLTLAQIPVGIVEYSTTTKKVTVTGEVSEILQLSPAEYEEHFATSETLVKKLAEIAACNGTAEKNLLYFKKAKTYVKMEQFQYVDSVLVLVMDVTRDVLEKERIKQERDTDVLTSLYNRRAFYCNAERIVDTASTPYMAVCVVDLDNLKFVNDSYGHEVGDLYIQSIADLIHFDCDYISGRLGGDEFASLLYNVPDLATLQAHTKDLERKQDGQSITLQNGHGHSTGFLGGLCLCAPGQFTRHGHH